MVMERKIRIVPADGTWVVRAGGAVIGESDRALEVLEDGRDPVIYFPREDLGMAFLDATDSTASSPGKGDARFYSIVTKSGVIRDAGWSYETPAAGAERIAGHIAFDAEKVTVEEV
jgi:uncharacterized protein (DUF427 family)